MRGAFVVFSYKQPVDGGKVRCGVVSEVRDTQAQPVRPNRYYRQGDKDFKRSQLLVTLHSFRSVKRFYAERSDWAVVLPLVGYPLLWFKAWQEKRTARKAARKVHALQSA